MAKYVHVMNNIINKKLKLNRSYVHHGNTCVISGGYIAQRFISTDIVIAHQGNSSLCVGGSTRGHGG